MTCEMEKDRIEKFGDVVIQHGLFNNRIYLMQMGEENPEEIIKFLHNMAMEHGYTKIFAKVSKKQSQAFIHDGYRIEAVIPLLYRSQEEVVFLGEYSSADRAEIKQAEQIEACLQLAYSRASPQPAQVYLPEGVHLRMCVSEDADEMSVLYKAVFKTYPFPIHDPDYIRDTMQRNVMYFGVDLSGRLIALASAEMSIPGSNVEMTDFATDPAWRGHGLAICLLDRMEQEMVVRKIKTAYTIARALSPSMNISFSKMGYHFGGTLINNTNIDGQIESMNVWYKYLF